MPATRPPSPPARRLQSPCSPPRGHSRHAPPEDPPEDTLRGLRDRAILAVLLYHGLRRDELVKLPGGGRWMCTRGGGAEEGGRGVPHLRARGKGGKTRYLPLHTTASDRIHVYLEAAGHGAPGSDTKGPLFRPVRNRTSAAGNAGGSPPKGCTGV